MSLENLILLTDSYKVSHARQYPPGTTRIYSYFESRGGRFNEVVFFGLTYYLKRYLSSRITSAEIDEAQDVFDRHLTPGLFNRQGWEHVLREHGGLLPVSIKAVPEGTPVPVLNVMMTVENTCPLCYWVTNYIETLLVQVWYGSTVATLSREMKKLLLRGLRVSGDPAGVDFKLHDFGFRGVSSVESAGVGGAAHLVNFLGTDTVAGLIVARDYYGADMAGFSIPAAEHSTITAWTKEREAEAYENMLDRFPSGLVAVVSDSYDVYNACRNIWGKRLRDRVLARDGTLVVRPDSGVPHEVVPNVLDILGEAFGYAVNEKGFKVLDPHVRVIQGDGVDYDVARKIIDAMIERRWSVDNIAFGMGGGLLQRVHRDTQMFALKCSFAVVDGQNIDVYKRPVTGEWKSSKKGRLKLIRANGSYATVAESADGEDQLVEVFRNGKILVEPSWDEIRRRAAAGL